MDGHVEFVQFGEKFPITEEALTVLAELAEYTPPTDWAPNHTLEDYPYETASSFHSTCESNLKRMGIVNKIHANDSQGEVYPPLSSEGGRIMCDSDAVYPDYTNDPIFYTCPARGPADPELFFDDEHYVYLSHLVVNDFDVQQFATAYAEVIGVGGDLGEDFEVTSSYGDSLFRLREGIERFLITDINNPASGISAQSTTPVMLEWPENHEGNSGGHVLFMDGHVEWMSYPGDFPMTESTIGTLRALAQNSPATEWADDTTLPIPYRSACDSNLRRWSFAHKSHADFTQGDFWSPLSLTPGELAARDDAIYPEHTNDRRLGVCPGTGQGEESVDHFDGRHYVYLGYVLLNDSDAEQFATAYGNEIASGGDFQGDFSIETSYGDTMVRFREGIERFTLEDGETMPLLYTPLRTIPVMVEWPGNHEGYAGGHVLYMDGHVEWHDYPGEFPMTEATIDALDSIADWTPTTAWTVPRFDSIHDYDHGLCASNERQFGLALKIFANSATGEFYPPLPTEDGTLMMDDARFFKYDLRDLRRMNCPGSANAYRQPTAEDHSYAYLGYVVHNQEDLERFATGHESQLAANGDFLEDLVVDDETAYRLREGIERFLITDINNPGLPIVPQHQLPVLIEWPDNHGNLRGGNVLYLDGSVAWLDYPSKFPMTEEAMAILTELAGRGPIRAAVAPAAESRLDAIVRENVGLRVP
jgi:prepilin-type processing-associated H-X9-DG protein